MHGEMAKTSEKNAAGGGKFEIKARRIRTEIYLIRIRRTTKDEF